jgi:hypothetical protein
VLVVQEAQIKPHHLMLLRAAILYFQALHRLVEAKVQMRTPKTVAMAAQAVVVLIIVVEELVAMVVQETLLQHHHHKEVLVVQLIQIVMVVPVAVEVQVL